MEKHKLLGSQFFALLFLMLLVIGGIASYTLGNFGGVSFDELGEKYIPKDDVKFSDLPLETQKRYIDKEATLAQSKEANALELENYVDEFGKAIPENAVNMQDLKRMITRLQKTLLFLHHDYFLMTNEKDELVQKIEMQQKEYEKEKQAWLQQSTQRLNEAEEHHFKNISELTLKLNDLQKENLLLSHKIESESNDLKSEIESQKAKQAQDDAKKHQEIHLAREEERAKFLSYETSIAELNTNLDALKEKLHLQEAEYQTRFENEKKELEIKNQLLESSTKQLQELEAKHTETLRLKEEAIVKENATHEEEVKHLKSELSSAKKHVDALLLESEKDLAKFKHYLDEEKKRYSELSFENQHYKEAMQAKIETLTLTVEKAKEEAAQKEQKLQELTQTITKLQAITQDIDKEVEKRVDEISQTHNKNYRIFNEKMAHFERYKQELLQQLDGQLNEYKATAKENFERIEHQNKELTQKNEALSLEKENYAKELQTVQQQLILLREKHEAMQQADMQKLKETHESLLRLQEQLKAKDESIKTLHVNHKEALKSKENAPRSNEPLNYIAQINCEDMGTGVDALSEKCKTDIKSFLSRYDRSYFFEITPIVDNSGFASLALLKTKKVGIEESEIERISALANIGLGKARAKAGGELVTSYVGEGAKISYALSNIEQAKARGFQIKVYR
ncbi:hypothetical protein [Sulfurospirillum barnesii]|uniref:Chromosome segregation ATPase n=1 Tax=Sulfurospirillum barnesii (strain ATCC 700032 / DSM 10660 / SES-3) TaxID=760154 RepID=I3XXA8_SULBS|nr:hypothetical protein [Sulfurospirillum barnesii]AFL68582.1 hypothetical protein Sulba_1290 [Sulfurospirillum barnesii SES-3]